MKPEQTIDGMTTEELIAYALTLNDEFAIAKALNHAFGEGFNKAMDLIQERTA